MAVSKVSRITEFLKLATPLIGEHSGLRCYHDAKACVNAMRCGTLTRIIQQLVKAVKPYRVGVSVSSESIVFTDLVRGTTLEIDR